MKMKTAIITGCNRGIGEGIKNSLLNKEYIVYGINRTPSTDTHQNYNDISCDISKKSDLEKAIQEIKYNTNSIDVLIPNAAIRKLIPIEKMSDNDWNSSIDINLNSVFYLTKAFLPDLIRSQGYHITIGSHSEKYTFANGAAYCASKAALRAFSECLLEEVRHKGVKVTYLSIGAVKNRNHGYDERRYEYLKNRK